MNAPLLKAVRDALVSSGWAVLRFNFRGIGRSEGEAGLGHDETMDAEGALAAMKERYPDLPLAIAGWSFGAAVAVRVAAKHPELVGCVAIAPAVKEKPGVTAGLPEPSEVDLAMPTLFLVGVNDDQTPPEACRAWAESAGISFSLMPGANHFFWAKYEKLAAEVVGFLEEAASSYLPRDEP